jgi:hypothetical protein
VKRYTAQGHIYDFLDVLGTPPLDFIVRAADARSFAEDDRPLLKSCGVGDSDVLKALPPGLFLFPRPEMWVMYSP